MDKEKNFYNVYFAGALFSHKDLIGNAALAEEIFADSDGEFKCILPQNIEYRKLSPRAIRDEDILNLIECDLAIFNFDGSELDSGTVVEFMFAKFADIPSLILRTDFRNGGDCVDENENNNFPWNLMVSFYPRTEALVLHAADIYKESMSESLSAENSLCASPTSGASTSKIMSAKIAEKVVQKLRILLTLSPSMPENISPCVYEWLAKMPDFADEKALDRLKLALSRKLSKKLL